MSIIGRSGTAAIFLVLAAAQAWTLGSTQADWRGHGVLTSQALVTSAYWPGIAAAAFGGVSVMLPRWRGLDAYQRTGVKTESDLARAAWVDVAAPVLSASVLATIVALVASWASAGFFGRPVAAMILTA